MATSDIPTRESSPTNVFTTSSLSAPASHSRVGVIWISLAAFVVVLILLGIFILQNNQSVDIRFLGAKGSISFGLAMLFAALAGVVLTLLIGSIRIIQLKLAGRSHDKQSYIGEHI